MIHFKKVWKELHDDGNVYAITKVYIDKEDCIRWKEYCESEKNRHFTQYFDEDYAETMSGETELWFAVEKKYESYLCLDRIDAFLLSMLHYAMASGSDIKSDVPISAELYYHIVTEIVPHLCIGEFRRIHLNAPIEYSVFPSEGESATGMSCGIDSFFTVWMNTQEDIPEKFRIKYFTFFNVGAINGVFPRDLNQDRRNRLMLETSHKKAAKAIEVADEIGAELVFVNSNISDYYRGMLVNSAHYRNCGTAMLLQGLWDKYYYSSAGMKPSDIKFDLCDDPAFHEAMLLPWFSNGTIQFISCGHAYSRIEKTEILADFDLAKKYLNVCDKDVNCGKCNKCKRTISSLIALGKLDNFSQRFDVEAIKKDIRYYKLYIYFKRKLHFQDEIYELAKERGLFSVPENVLFSVLYLPYKAVRKSEFWKKSRMKKYDKAVRTMK